MFVCTIIHSALPSLSFFYLYLINFFLDPKAVKCSFFKLLSICQRSFWLLQFGWLQIAPIVQTCSQLLMWCGKASMMIPLLVNTLQKQQVSRRPLGCFHKLKELLLLSEIPLQFGTFLCCPPASAAVLLQCATEIILAGRNCCLWFF